MRAVTWQGRREVGVDTVPDPSIKDPTDVVVRITSTALCGSDLHLCSAASPCWTSTTTATTSPTSCGR